MGTKLHLIDGNAILATEKKFPDSGEVSDVKCSICKKKDLKVEYELFKPTMFNSSVSTLYLHCEDCETWYTIEVVTEYEESEN